MDADPVTVSRQEWDAVLRRLADLEAQIARTQPLPVEPAPEGTLEMDGDQQAQLEPEPAAAVDRASVSRRRALLGLVGAAGAGIVGATATASPAAAGNGDPLYLGSSANTSTASTVHTVTGTGTFYGLAAVDNAIPGDATRSAILGSATGQAFKIAVRAVAAGSQTGVRATSDTGYAVEAISSAATAIHAEGAITGIRAYGTGGSGIAIRAIGVGFGVLAQGRDSLLLYAGEENPPPNRSGVNYAGAVAADGLGDLWYCTAEGTPGTWRKLSGAKTAGAFHLLPAPVRVYNSRAGTSPAVGTKAPFGSNTTRMFDLKVNNSAVPAGATGALVTILLVNAAATSGNLTIWANGVSRPQSNTMVWGGAAGRFTATAVTALDSLARCQVNASAKTDLVLDVVGYYR